MEETKEAKYRNKIQNLENNETNENNDNGTNENDYLTKKMNDIMNDFTLPKLDFDEFEIFNQLYKKLIGINETKTLIDKIIEEMSESDKKEFKNILLIKKIKIIKDNNDDIIDEKTEETVHRRIVEIIRK